jgi:hypothetical protein
LNDRSLASHRWSIFAITISHGRSVRIGSSPPAKRARLAELIVASQNQMHGTKRGHTVADIMVERAKATASLIGTKTTRLGSFIRTEDMTNATHRQFLPHVSR